MKTFFVGVKGVIIKNGKVLLLKHEDGRWEVPGGRIDGNETIMQTLERELTEELPNIRNIVATDLLDAQRLYKDLKDNVSLMLLFYAVKAEFDGDPKLSEEHSEAQWLSQEEASKIVDDEVKLAITCAFKLAG